jgi:hypothetical protein
VAIRVVKHHREVGVVLQHCVLECDGKMVKDEDMRQMEGSFFG